MAFHTFVNVPPSVQSVPSVKRELTFGSSLLPFLFLCLLLLYLCDGELRAALRRGSDGDHPCFAPALRFPAAGDLLASKLPYTALIKLA